MTTDVMEKTNFNLLNRPTQPAVCEHHGKFDSVNIHSDLWSGCPACADESDTKALSAARELRRKEHEEWTARKEREEWQRRLRDCGIPERFRDRTLDSFVVDSEKKKAALDFCREYAENFEANPGKCAILVGTPGTGKTHLAVGIGIELMNRKGSVLFVTAIRALRRIKDSWSKGSTITESEAVDSLVWPQLLILDEVGVQFGSDAEKILLFDVLNERYEKRKSTIIISNLTMPEVKEYLGERIFDRMREDGGKSIAFDWKSHRVKA